MKSIKILGAFVIMLMISLAACAPARTNTVVVRNQPRVVVVKKPGPNKVIVVRPVRNNRHNNGHNCHH